METLTHPLSARPHLLARTLPQLRKLSTSPAFPPTLLFLSFFGIAQTWFRAGTYVAFGDVFPVGFVDAHDALTRSRFLWGSGITGTGGPDYSSTLQTLPAAFAQGIEAIGFSPEAAQRLFLSALFAAAVPAMYLLLRTVWPRQERRGAIIGAAFYGANPAMFIVLPNGVLMASYALLPLIAALLGRGAQSGRLRYAAMVGATSPLVAYAALNPPALALVAVAAILALVLAAWRHPRRAARFTAVTVPIFFMLSAWWLMPIALLFSRPGGQALSVDVSPFAWQWTTARSTISNILRLTPEWGWPQPEYFPYAHFFETREMLAVALVPAVLTGGAAFVPGARRATAAACAVTAGVFTFLAKGLHDPFGGVNGALYHNVPGMWLFRDPASKFTTVLAGIFAMGICAFITRLPRPQSILTALACVPIVAVLGYPLWTGAVIPGPRPLHPSAHVRVPDSWLQATAFIRERGGRTLILPLDDYYQVRYAWGFYGADVVPDELIGNSALKLLPSTATYQQPDAAFTRIGLELRSALTSARYSDAAALMRMLGVRWILLRRDLAPNKWTPFSPPSAVLKRLVRQSFCRHVRTFGSLDVFELRQSHPMVWTSQDVVRAASSDVPKLASLPTLRRTPLVQAPTPGIPQGTARLIRLAGAAVSPTGSGGRRTRPSEALWQHWTQGAVASVIAIAGPPARVELQWPQPDPRGGTRSKTLATGRKRHQWLVSLDGRVVLLDPTLAAQPVYEPKDEQPVEVAVAKLSDASVLSDSSFERGAWGRVGDCDVSDQRSRRQVGIRATRVRDATDGSFSLELGAAAHAACVRQTVMKFKPTALYRLQFDARRLSGAPPHICVWETGLNRCKRTPQPLGSTTWRHYDIAFAPDRGTRGLQLYLYALGTDGPARERYDAVLLSEYSTVEHHSLDLSRSASWIQIGRSGARLRESIKLEGFTKPQPLLADSFERGTWGPVGDCNAFDGRPIRQVGIAAARVAGGTTGAYSLQLSARAHAACVAAVVPIEYAHALYKIELDTRRLKGALPRLCLWEVGPNECAPLPQVQNRRGWVRYQARVKPDETSKELMLFLYADGEPGGTTVRYDTVRVTRLVPKPTLAGLAKPLAGEGAPIVRADQRSPTRYRVHVQSARSPFLLALNQTYDTGWKLLGAPAASHIRVNGYANGWIVRRSGSYDLQLVYQPQELVDGARAASLAVLSLLVLLGTVTILRRWKPQAEQNL
jgi:arabinofuranan 3-O-arabinosyltransferase